MKTVKTLAMMLGLGMCFAFAGAKDAEAGYYSSWSYYPTYGYHYSSYYYKPFAAYTGYKYHYCVYYPSQPRYVYYYNPYTRAYWGRFDLQGKEGAQYSLLADKDRKGKLSEIPESAFPEPGQMPKVPETRGDERIEVPPAPPTGN